MSTKHRKLGELPKGSSGRIVAVGPVATPDVPDMHDAAGGHGASELQHAFLRRFMEMGLLEGADFQIVHEAPFSGDPIAVRVRGSLIALRRNEANQVTVFIHE